MTGSPRAIAIAGLAGVILNVVAVVALNPFTSPYSPADIPGWLESCGQYPIRTAVSSFAFTFGLVALAAFALGFAAHLRTAPAVVAAVFIGLGALLDAAGTPAPLVALNADPAVGQAFLRYTLILDATFNGCLGVGLIAAFFAQRSKLRWLALASGILSLPIAFQWMSADAAKLLMLAGPAWLAWIAATSIELLRTEQ
ncbi:MAG: hypothetical protein JNJ54_22975 [Myxococcaceae bacterium]|nr:hypothetical protein [Myxococcaceae bacterium]